MTPEYQSALERAQHPLYRVVIPAATSFSILALQAIGLMRVSWSWSACLVGYVFADLVNGIVHIIADNNTRYSGPLGPLVAVFHQHHHRAYQERPLALVYVTEIGSKVWLVPVLLASTSSAVLVFFGVFSGLAEVSHYLAHRTRRGRFVRLLQRAWVLLPPDHHAVHHREDNNNYAFLNGMSDPLLNLISRGLRLGYVERADRDSEPEK